MTVPIRLGVLALSVMLLCGTAVVGLANSAYADLQLLEPDPTVGATECGNVGFSSDGLGQLTDDGTLQAEVLAGSTIEQAYLYGATFFAEGVPTIDVTLDGTTHTLALLTNNEHTFLETYRADVTTQVATTIGAAGGIFNFVVTGDAAVTNLDGVALVVIFTNPALPQGCISVLDGGLAPTPAQTTTVGFAEPIDKDLPGFQIIMAVGSSFSFQGSTTDHLCGTGTAQGSDIDVNGEELTSCAGHYDDAKEAFGSNGNLITVGGVGDDLLNPDNPSQKPGDGTLPRTTDDELYDITSFVGDGDTDIEFVTENSSTDDNLFLIILGVTGAKTSVGEICGDGIDNDGDGLIDEGCEPPPDDDCSDENVLLADAGVIGVGGTTDLTQKIDTCNGLTGEIKTWTVLDADGDTCTADSLPATIPASGEVTRTFPDDFLLAQAGGDGICDTGDVGIYNSQTEVEIDGVVTGFSEEFETNFFVIPETPIGIAALLGASLAALGAFMYHRKRSSRNDVSDSLAGLGI